jgi:hypothetical protein
MYELTGKIQNVSFSYLNSKPLVTFEINENQSALALVDELKDAEKLSLKVSKHREKRSLDANAYAWVLIGKIAEKTNVSNTEVYRNAIKEIGGNFDIVCVQDKAVDSLCEGWSRNGLGWQTDTMSSKIDGCTNVVLYYGSSTYNTEQMSRLISNIKQDCDALGIETKSPEEIASLLSAWG